MLIFVKKLFYEQNNYTIISHGGSEHPPDEKTYLSNLEILHNTGLN